MDIGVAEFGRHSPLTAGNDIGREIDITPHFQCQSYKTEVGNAAQMSEVLGSLSRARYSVNRSKRLRKLDQPSCHPPPVRP